LVVLLRTTPLLGVLSRSDFVVVIVIRIRGRPERRVHRRRWFFLLLFVFMTMVSQGKHVSFLFSSVNERKEYSVCVV